MRRAFDLRPLAALATTLGLVLATVPAQAQSPEASQRSYEAEIRRTSYGIPHILADDFGSLGFGQGYGAAEDIICSLAEVLVTASGERSKWFGPDETWTDEVTLTATNLQSDVLFRDINNRRVVEDLLDSTEPGVAPGPEIREIVEGYVAGLNTYLEDIGGADGIEDPACAGAPWVRPAVPLDLYRGIYAANLLASAGVFVPEIVEAAPPAESGETGLPLATNAVGFPLPPEVLPDGDELRAGLGKDDEGPFGSNGSALGGDVTATGRGMVLGNPHFPWQGRYRFTQSHLRLRDGSYDVAGGMLHGSPVVNIGFNEDIAWTHTVSTAYRFTPYEYRLLDGATTYATESGPRSLERREVEVELPDGTTITEDLYRTDEGYVLSAPALLMGWTPASVWAIREANGEHLRTLDVFHEMAKGKDVNELLANQDRAAGMPWVNTIAADRDGNAMYADHSVVPHVTNAMAQECMTPVGRALFELAGLPGLDGTRAQGDCAWGSDDDAARAGVLGPANLPEAISRQWHENSNDSYWLPNPDLAPIEGFSRIIGCERCVRSLRTRMMYDYLRGITADGQATLEDLMATEVENRVLGAELARENGDLDAVCQASSAPAEFCDALAAWDGRTNIDSRGAHLFREFFGRGDARTWEVPFDVDDPAGTPRDLDEADADVIAAMDAAVADVDAMGVAYDAPLGDLQRAGDDGAGAIPIHGGSGTIGNANLLSFGSGTANLDVPYPVSYGSSHIQAVAFTDDGVDAHTILTYSQAYDPTSDHHDDQTALWSQERWVDFAFTEAEIAADLVSSKVVSSGPVAPPTPQPAPEPSPLPATGGGLVVLGLLGMAAGPVRARLRAPRTTGS